ncbi:peptidase M20 domain-containing protein 2-like isoform X1 [Acanthaster planci]|nr:peptidase M20 domain-containing protein 2-like isoform X1 [Acanthaster planci]XP_022092537.1 peptidase M20 domain-containing protein 2-like isoform X1 [Acanthaster planci]XP_022092538.1 peptidase M20 domain-containing protein 2-like isoform X1 [Acanthaster planci]
MADFMKVAKAKIDASASNLNALSQEIWSHPELNFNEHHAHEVLTDFLEKEGFNVERHFVLETAFRATFGSDNAGPNICVICEYDALPDIGHACGHNLIAECGVAAGLGIKAALEASGNKYGKVTVLGTPAEEGGGGKRLLIKANAFTGIAVAMMAHPYRYNVPRPIALSMTTVIIKFQGKASHASAAPWDGNNALDAAVMCYQAISNMRQQIKPTCRVHGIFTNGGAAPNIIPEEAELTYYLRAIDEGELSVLKRKVRACAEGAAKAAECQVEFRTNITYANLITNDGLSSMYESHVQRMGVEFSTDEALRQGGSTDMGNVSYLVPSIHPKFAVGPGDVATHTGPFTTVAGSPEAQGPTLIQAKALAMTAIELMQPSGQDTLKKIQKEFKDTVSKLQMPE